MNFAEKDNELIMHCTLKIGISILHGADVADTHAGFVSGTNFSISYAPESRESADAIFALLSSGGEVTMPLQDTFWGSYFGTCTDKFGNQWMFNFAREQ